MTARGYEMIIRSAFWLCVGFALVAPHGTDFGAAAGQVRDQAIEAGTQAVAQIVVDQALAPHAVDAIASSFISQAPAVANPTRIAPKPAFVFPRTRPAALG
jgi:hypothetical protein